MERSTRSGASLPYSDFDLVVVDAWDSMAEGMGEQDSSKPARALAPLLDVCHRENGTAVLLLGNTIKSAQHSRGSGVVEDRADIVYEVRDTTGFRLRYFEARCLKNSRSPLRTVPASST